MLNTNTLLSCLMLGTPCVRPHLQASRHWSKAQPSTSWRKTPGRQHWLSLGTGAQARWVWVWFEKWLRRVSVRGSRPAQMQACADMADMVPT